MWEGSTITPEGELKVSFGYQCNGHEAKSCIVSNGCTSLPKTIIQRTSSFSCLSGAALSANATLANTNICNGVIGAEILPSWDSPNSFRKIPSSPSLSRLDILSSSLQSNLSNLSCSPSTPSDTPEYDTFSLKSMSAPSGSEGFLNTMEVQVAGGAAGEDRVQAVCSEENGWLFCAIYDGFNGRDAADFLAGTLYETIIYYFSLLDWNARQDCTRAPNGSLQCVLESGIIGQKGGISSMIDGDNGLYSKGEVSSDLFRHGVLDGLKCALDQAENDFLYMVEQEMDDRPDLVSVGSCVLVAFLHGKDLYTLNLGDSRAVLATYNDGNEKSENERLKAIQLTDSHTVDNDAERAQLLSDHPDDQMTIVSGKVKGKLKVTRALGVGYLKKEKLNDALMGILRVRNLISPPYISTHPSLNVHRISESDHFVILGSDGLFDFFSNEDAVRLVHSYILKDPSGDPAKFLLEQVVERAADSAGFSREEMMNIPAGRRRKYHDDVTVIVVILGTNQRTTKASTCM
ncbi:Phosphatase 2C family protein isoform 1 [Tripterygium wilfordii]|uniref:Phosphatase 2C family protein isoform 1 n=1 Tax=Tripterygium wilfordii TaxID=458696 RepID=A0A7J7E0U7_TRIWF|nr:probable protein phosphatase 2C 40 [Tripterygium wilfordii]XP_038701310.1 probable protein phosphatase 2C 40 [Tripterygium wilfordii]XP_038701384.1 probable protein phosphatase 2C 40 [Tripterygium wilfordii]KAF5752207.1 Phosphatase 2C family protein isoform 1 [Tripterygium wilfordii]